MWHGSLQPYYIVELCVDHYAIEEESVSAEIHTG